MNNTKQLLNGIWTKINNLIDKKNNLQLLEPLSTIIRLCILNFDLEGTKIAIYNNRIFNQSPNFMQGTVRWTYGNKRNELHHLYRPIVMATNKYDIDNNNIRIIFKYAIKGLDKLKKTYKKIDGTIICHSIDLYKETITRILNKKKLEISNQLKNDDITNQLYQEFYNLWDNEQIEIIAKLLIKSDKLNDSDDVLSYIKAIDSIIKRKELKSLELIHKKTENITN